MAELLRLNRAERRAELGPRGAEQHGRDLDRIADQVRAAYERALAAEKEWIAATIELAEKLAAARARFKANRQFNHWLVENCEFLPRNDRAALIGMGRNLELTRTVLATTHRRSWRLIWEDQIQPQLETRLHSAGKTTTAAADGASYAIESILAESQMQRDFVHKVMENFRPQFRPGDTFHDGVRGTNRGGFFPVLPRPRSWSELQRGRDFLKWTTPRTWLFGNPPWGPGEAYRELMEHAFEIAENVVVLVRLDVGLNTYARVDDALRLGHGIKKVIRVQWREAFGQDGPEDGRPLVLIHWQRGYKSKEWEFWD